MDRNEKILLGAGAVSVAALLYFVTRKPTQDAAKPPIQKANLPEGGTTPAPTPTPTPTVTPSPSMAAMVAPGLELQGYLLQHGCDCTSALTDRARVFQHAVNQSKASGLYNGASLDEWGVYDQPTADALKAVLQIPMVPPICGPCLPAHPQPPHALSPMALSPAMPAPNPNFFPTPKPTGGGISPGDLHPTTPNPNFFPVTMPSAPSPAMPQSAWSVASVHPGYDNGWDVINDTMGRQEMWASFTQDPGYDVVPVSQAMHQAGLVLNYFPAGSVPPVTGLPSGAASEEAFWHVQAIAPAGMWIHFNREPLSVMVRPR